jgi:hypothetical protein
LIWWKQASGGQTPTAALPIVLLDRENFQETLENLSFHGKVHNNTYYCVTVTAFVPRATNVTVLQPYNSNISNPD